MKFLILFLFSLILGCQSLTRQEKNTSADMILINGRVISMKTEGDIQSAIAIRGMKIIEVGENDKVLKFRGEDTKVIDLEGKTVLPGLVEGHGHLFGIGRRLQQLQLAGISDFDQILEMVKGTALKTPKNIWITGSGWDQNLWKHKMFPSAKQLDNVSANNPVILTRVDGHAVWLNSAAMKLAGINKLTTSPAGGRIIRDVQGIATGILVDKAINLVANVVPDTSDEQREQAILAAMQLALKNGITTFHDAGVGEKNLTIYEQLVERDRLPLKVFVMLQGSDPDFFARSLQRGPFQKQNLTVRSIKFLADGALGSRGASLLAPYQDNPSHSGLLIIGENEIFRLTDQALSAGFQVGTHAIGDRANREVLNGYIRAIKKHRDQDHRLRVEHAQILSVSDIGKFAKWNIIASMQPTHCTSDSPWVPQRIGRARESGGAYVWQKLLKSGAMIVSGSDAPVESVNPFWGLYSAITRQDHRGRPSSGWNASQRMSFYQALKSYTSDSAYAGFVENETGKIQKGMFADIIVVDQDLADSHFRPSLLLKTKVEMTMINGKVVYRSGNLL